MFGGLNFLILLSVAKIMCSKLVIDGMQVGIHRLSNSAEFWPLYKILFTNWIMMIFSLGLASPFCAIRLFKYKVESISIQGTKNFRTYQQKSSEAGSALGDQFGDVFNLGFDFGF